ncbi:MAG: sialidase family protein [Isosphaeraceae bacterium]
MRITFVLAFLLSVLGGSPASAAEPFFSAVPIFPTEKKHNHASCIVEVSNGDLLAVWYNGTGERSADDVRIQGAWLKKGNTLWGPRVTLADTPGYPDCNPAVFAAPDGTIWLTWPTILDHRWEGALLKFAVAKDDGVHSGPLNWVREGVFHITPVGFDEDWAKAVGGLPAEIPARLKKEFDTAAQRSKDQLYQRLGWMPRVHFTVLPSGRWLLPLYTDTFSASIVLYSDDQGKTWLTSKPMIGFGNIQPSLVVRKDGTVVAFMRDNGPFRKIRQAESHDNGETWSAVTSSALPNPGAGVEAVKLASGRWAMIYNDTERGRHSLAVSLSEDEGKTWTKTRHVEIQSPGSGSFHYPSIMQARDGTIHVTYTHGGTPEGSTIEHARFNEEWVLQGDRR